MSSMSRPSPLMFNRPASPLFSSRMHPPASPLFSRVQNPSSPLLTRVQSPITASDLNPAASTQSSPSITVRMQQMHIATSPSSPNKTMQFTAFQSSPTVSPRRMQLNIATTASSGATTATASKHSAVLSNNRVQPVASPMKKSKKRKLGPGCGLLDWIRLCRKMKDLAGNGGVVRSITVEELGKHNTEEDAWTAINGKVYNLTHYMKFHPGGKEDLMKGAGIDCTILFNEAHSWVNVESQLKACYVGPLVNSSPNTQRRNSFNIKKNARKQNDTLLVPKTIVSNDGVNKKALPMRKNSMELRTETQAATAIEEHDGIRLISPESPIRPEVGETKSKKMSTASLEAAESSSVRLAPPPTRMRRTSEPHPRIDWVQSEKTVTVHVLTKNMALKTSDIVLDLDGKVFEAAIFISDWVFELNIALAHAVVASQVSINCGRVEICLKKEVPHQQWDSIGTFLNGHALLCPKSRRGVKYHSTYVESINDVTHDTKLFTLRLPAGSHLNVPTGHHLSVKANINGEEVERSYTPVTPLEAATLQRQGQPILSQQKDGETIELMIKLYKDGKMSGFLSNLKKGDKVTISDPEGTFDASSKLTPASDILLLAAGSGFTPMVKILREFLASELVSSRQRNSSTSEASGEAGEENQQAQEFPPLTNNGSNSEVMPTNTSPKRAKLIFANKKEKDVMCREELDHLSSATAERFTPIHVLSDADKEWSGLKGRINECLLKTHLPAVKEQNHKNILVGVCGPEPFTANITNILLDLEYPEECIHIFQ